jgi:hypothetical protein
MSICTFAVVILFFIGCVVSQENKQLDVELSTNVTLNCDIQAMSEFIEGYRTNLKENSFNIYLDRVCLFYYDRFVENNSKVYFSDNVTTCIRKNFEVTDFGFDACDNLIEDYVYGCCADNCYRNACNNKTVENKPFICGSSDTVGKLGLFGECIRNTVDGTCVGSFYDCKEYYNLFDFFSSNENATAMLNCYDFRLTNPYCNTDSCYQKVCNTTDSVYNISPTGSSNNPTTNPLSSTNETPIKSFVLTLLSMMIFSFLFN